MTGYPPGPNTRGWRMDDEKATYPLYETLRKYGIRNICVHKGVPALFLAEYCHTDDVARAAADFPDLNLSPITSRSRGRPNSPSTASARNKEPTAFLIGQNPRRYARLVGTLLAGLGPTRFSGYRHAGDRTAAMADRGLPGVHDPGRPPGALRLSAIGRRHQTQDLGRERRKALWSRHRTNTQAHRSRPPLLAAGRP